MVQIELNRFRSRKKRCVLFQSAKFHVSTISLLFLCWLKSLFFNWSSVWHLIINYPHLSIWNFDPHCRHVTYMPAVIRQMDRKLWRSFVCQIYACGHGHRSQFRYHDLYMCHSFASECHVANSVCSTGALCSAEFKILITSLNPLQDPLEAIRTFEETHSLLCHHVLRCELF